MGAKAGVSQMSFRPEMKSGGEGPGREPGCGLATDAPLGAHTHATKPWIKFQIASHARYLGHNRAEETASAGERAETASRGGARHSDSPLLPDTIVFTFTRGLSMKVAVCA